MLQITSAAIVGIEAVPVTVETDISFGLSAFHMVGLPDTAVKESRERIRAAIRNSGFSFPRVRITVNLAPADIKKQGPTYDLPIALSILLAGGEFDRQAIAGAVMVGELALDGSIRPATGVLASALMAKRHGYQVLFVPEANVTEASSVEGLCVFPATTLRSVVEHLQGTHLITATLPSISTRPLTPDGIDLRDIRGQQQAKRALEIAAAGGHNVLLNGPPGTGKTLLARAIPSILPSLSHEESLDVTVIASIAGLLPPGSSLVSARPFRAPHHSSSAVSLVGGGTWPRPGEVSLAHRGVLFLDELPEFPRHVLEHLRQPLEDGVVTISRASASVRFPSRFLLVAAMNPCPCGFASDPRRPCVCPPGTLAKYRRRISGPMLDRFDLVIEVPNLEAKTLTEGPTGEASCDIRTRVEAARAIQRTRFASSTAMTNGEMPISKLDVWCPLDTEGKRLLEQALSTHQLSARGFARVRKVARTIADLDGSATMTSTHIAEALHYRTNTICE